jgi:hypothetical protein
VKLPRFGGQVGLGCSVVGLVSPLIVGRLR